MFPVRYFPVRFYAPRYWANVGAEPPPVTLVGGDFHQEPNLPLELAQTALQGTSAELAGVPLLASKPIRWSLREGVEPVVETFEIPASDAQSLRVIQQNKRPVSLSINVRGEETRFDNLWILGFPPGPNPHIRSVRVADRRWLWPYSHITRRYNMRRKVGVKRTQSPTAELTDVVDDVQYGRWSLRNQEGSPPGATWSAEEILEDVLSALASGEETFVGESPPGFALDDSIDFAALPVENFELDDSGQRALARVLGFLPGVGVFVEPGGTLRVYSKTDRGERDQRDDAGPEAVDFGHVEEVSQALVRPQKVAVYFTIEAELRFDYAEQSGETVVAIDERAKEEGLLLDNVLPLPDFSLPVAGRFEHQGTWVRFDDAFSAWGASSKFGSAIDHQAVRRSLVPFVDPFAAFVQGAAAAEPDIDWAARVGAIVQHYRRTFRLPQRWMDRILALRAHRVATVDQATGSRASSNAFADYAVVQQGRPFVSATAEMVYVLNVKGYPQSGDPLPPEGLGILAIDDSTKPIPANVRIVDQDQGIVHLEFLPSSTRLFSAFLPGTVKDGFIPTADVSLVSIAQGNVIAFDARPFTLAKILELDPSWKLAVILTAIPASPNSKEQLFRLEVEPDAVDNLVPGGTEAGFGPIMEVRVPASVETARVRWLDSEKDSLRKLFGILTEGERQDLEEGESPQQPDISSLVVNLRSNAVVGQSSSREGGLEAIARAEAARVYAAFRDRLEGEMAGDMGRQEARGLRPDGTLEEVAFELSPNGLAFVRLSFPERIEELSMFSFLDPGTRAAVMRLADVKVAV